MLNYDEYLNFMIDNKIYSKSIIKNRDLIVVTGIAGDVNFSFNIVNKHTICFYNIEFFFNDLKRIKSFNLIESFMNCLISQGYYPVKILLYGLEYDFTLEMIYSIIDSGDIANCKIIFSNKFSYNGYSNDNEIFEYYYAIIPVKVDRYPRIHNNVLSSTIKDIPAIVKRNNITDYEVKLIKLDANFDILFKSPDFIESEYLINDYAIDEYIVDEIENDIYDE